MKELERRAAALPAWTWGLVPALVCLVTGLTDRLYTDIDSFYVSVVTNGLYGNSFCQNNHPLLGLIVGALAQIFPQADWFALLTRILVTFAVWWCSVLLAKCVPFGARRLALWFLLILFLLRNTLYNKNYTIHSAMFMALGVLTCLLALRFPLGRTARWIAAGFAAAGILFRVKSSVLLFPFLALSVVFWLFWDCSKGKLRTSFRYLLHVFVPSICTVGSLLLFFSVFYTFTPYRTDMAYDDARVTLGDYPAKDWEDVRAVLEPAGISENDYLCMSGGILMDTEVLTIEKLQLAAKVNSAQRLSVTPQAFTDAVHDLRAATAESPLLQWTLLLAALAVLGVFLLPCRRCEKVMSLLACCGAGVIVLYFALLGRTRDRVVIAVLFGVLSVCLPPLLAVQARPGALLHHLRQISCVLLGGVCLVLMLRRSYGGVQLACTARVPEEPTTEGESGSDTVYLWNSMLLALQLTEQYMQPGKLPSADYLQHNIPYGEWISGQRYLNETLTEIGLANPLRALAERSDVRLVADDVSLLQTFLREHYGTDITFTQVATKDVFAVGETPVWQAVG